MMLNKGEIKTCKQELNNYIVSSLRKFQKRIKELI